MIRMPAGVEMDVAGEAEAEGARRATGAFGSSATSRAADPDPEVPAKVQRRQRITTVGARPPSGAAAVRLHAPAEGST